MAHVAQPEFSPLSVFAERVAMRYANKAKGKAAAVRVAGRFIQATRWPKPRRPHPTMRKLEKWTFDSVVEATDGCRVEPDGVCPHGYPSWLLYLGMI
jgi:hypothetical protein